MAARRSRCGQLWGGWHDTRDTVGSQASAIYEGWVDEDLPQRNASVRLQAPNSFCTGTLITPRRVLTASHCMLGENDWTNAFPVCTPAVTNKPGWAPNLPTVGFGLTVSDHSLPVLQSVNVATQFSRLNAPTDYQQTPCPVPMSEHQDLAMMVLSKRPRIGTGSGNWNVQPVHPWEQGHTCADSFTSLYSGYGAIDVNNLTTLPPQRMAYSYPVSFNFTYEATFGDPYHGTLPGDSGGPLFDISQAAYLVCGASSVYGTFVGFSRWARVDRYFNDDFIRDTAWSYKTNNWVGECTGNDGDVDGIPDDCDTCKTFWNADQSDSDNDGIGDACDNCYLTASPITSDSNHDAEVVDHGEPAPPPVWTERAPAYLTQGWPGDVCDGHALTTTSSTALGWGPSTGGSEVRRATYSLDSGEGCPVSSIEAQKSVSQKNVLEASSFIATVANHHGWTRPLRCPCPEGVADHDCETDYNCSRSNVATPFGNWDTVHLVDATSGMPVNANSDLFAQSEYPSVGAPKGKGGKLAPASNVSWGWAYWQDLTLSPYVRPSSNDPYAVASTRVYDGLLWTWVFGHFESTYPVPGRSVPTGYLSDQRQRQYVTRIQVDENLPARVHGPACYVVNKPAAVPVSLDYCPMCGSLAFINIPVGDPNPYEKGVYLRPGFANRSANLDASFVDAYLEPSLTLVTAQDARSGWNGSGAGVFVDVGGRHLKSIVRDEGNGTLSFEDVSAAIPGAGAIVAAVSGQRQEVAFFLAGEHSVFIYDMDTHASHLQRIDVGGWKTPVAATYRPELDEYDVLDDTEDQIRLLRVRHGIVAEELIAWSRTGNFPSYGLSTAPDGSLVLSTWNGEHFNVAVLQTPGESFAGDDPVEGKLTLAYLATNQTGALAAPVIRSFDGLLLLKTGSYGRLETQRVPIAFSELDPGDASACF